MLVTLNHVAEAINALYDFVPGVYDNCVCFQLFSPTGNIVDVILSVEDGEGITEDRPVMQAVRIGLYFVDKDGPLNFISKGLPTTLEFLHKLQPLTHWGSLRAYEGEQKLEVFLSAMVPVTLSELQKFCKLEAPCQFADILVFLMEEWEDLNGVLAAFSYDQIGVSDEQLNLLFAYPAGYA